MSVYIVAVQILRNNLQVVLLCVYIYIYIHACQHRSLFVLLQLAKVVESLKVLGSHVRSLLHQTRSHLGDKHVMDHRQL